MSVRRRGPGSVAPAGVALAAVRDLRALLRVGVGREQIERERTEVERRGQARLAEEEAEREAARERGRRARHVDYSAAALPAMRGLPPVPDVQPLLSACGFSLMHAGEVLHAGDYDAGSLASVVSELRERERDARAWIDAWPAELPWSIERAGRTHVHPVYSAAQAVGGVVALAAYYLAEVDRCLSTRNP